MGSRDADEQLVKYLADVHSIEEQALTQMRRAPELVEGPLAAAFNRHLEETEGHEQLVRERLEAHDASPSTAKDTAGKAGGAGMVLFAQSQPDTPGKLIAHAYSYEHMEVAAYELLRRVAERAGDEQTAAAASRIGAEEREMVARLEELFDSALDASLAALDDPEPGSQLEKYLADAHAVEAQSETLLERGAGLAEADELAAVLSAHRDETLEQRRRLERRLEARGASSSAAKDAALRLGGLNWAAFLAAQPDSPAKLAGFAFALEHLEVASYELLHRMAERAGDRETATVAATSLDEERGAARAIATCWDEALEAS